MNARISILLFCLVLRHALSQNNALNFDGINDHVVIGNKSTLDFSDSDKFTIEAWFNTTSFASNVILAKMTNNSPYIGYDFFVINGKVAMDFESNYPSSYILVHTVNTFNDGNWHHVAWVYHGLPNANNIETYVDGQLQNVNILSNNLVGSPLNNAPVVIGSRDGAAYFFNGYIDEVRIWRTDLCKDQILQHKNCHLTGNEPYLAAYYQFNQGNAAGNNSGVNTALDLLGNNPGALTNFALSGATSNWVNSNAGVSGICTALTSTLFIGFTGNNVSCSGAPVVITATANGTPSFTWNSGSNSQSISATPSVNTTFTVSVGNAAGCIETSTITVFSGTTPTIVAVGPSGTICSGQNINLASSGASNYTWQPGNHTGFYVQVTPTITTTYTVTGSNGTCIDTTLYTQVVTICTAIEGDFSLPDINIFPNPATSEITISGAPRFTVEITSSSGELLMVKDANNQTTLDLTTFPGGVYFLRLRAGENSVNRKVVKY